MKKYRMYKYILFAVVALMWGGCKVPSLTLEEQVDLPEVIARESADALPFDSISWKEFFPDTFLVAYIDTALARNYTFLQTLEHVSVAREQLRIRRGALLPELSLGVQGGVERFGEYTMDGVGNATTNTPDLAQDKHIPDPYRSISLGLGFQWEIDVWGKLTDKKRAAAMRWMKSMEAKQLAQTILVSEVASQYYYLVGLDKKCLILEEEIQKNRDSYKLTNELMKEGEVSRLSVNQFLSRRMKLEEMLLDTRQKVEEVERSLALLMGKLPFSIKRTSFDKLNGYQYPSAKGIPVRLLLNRPDVKVAELELLASKSDVRAARKAFFPSLNLGGSGGFSAFDLEKWFVSPASLVYNLAAGITAPVFKRHEIRALWNESKANQRIALLEYHHTVLKSYQEITNLLSASVQMEKRKQLKIEESRIHHRSIEYANELFKTGFVGYLDVLSADERYLECELERIDLTVGYCQLHAQLYRALGGGQF